MLVLCGLHAVSIHRSAYSLFLDMFDYTIHNMLDIRDTHIRQHEAIRPRTFTLAFKVR